MPRREAENSFTAVQCADEHLGFWVQGLGFQSEPPRQILALSPSDVPDAFHSRIDECVNRIQHVNLRIMTAVGSLDLSGCVATTSTLQGISLQKRHGLDLYKKVQCALLARGYL